MNGFRRVGLWAAGLVWLTVGGCADTSESNTKPKYTGPMILSEEIDPDDKALADEPLTLEIPLDQIWALDDMPGTRDMDKLIPAREKSRFARRLYLTNLRKALAPKQPVEKAATGFALTLREGIYPP